MVCDVAVKRLTLIVHHLCPYAQRSLYTVAFKCLNHVTILEVPLDKKPEILLSTSPLGKVPVLALETDSGNAAISESKEVSEYLDSFPGPGLYPRNADGTVCPIKKGLIDMHLKLTVDPLPPLFFQILSGKANSQAVSRARKMLKIIDEKYLGDGGFFMHTILRENVLTFADVMLYPFAERLFAYKNSGFTQIWAGTDFRNIEKWYTTMSSFPWIQRFKADPQRLRKVQTEYAAGTFKGLRLPLTLYD